MSRKEIKFTYGEKEYTLEFTRSVIAKMESDGVVIAELDKQPISNIPKLFKYSFLAHHKGISDKTVDEIWSNLGNKQGVIEKLSMMCVETVNSLFEEPAKNAVTWEANF